MKIGQQYISIVKLPLESSSSSLIDIVFLFIGVPFTLYLNLLNQIPLTPYHTSDKNRPKINENNKEGEFATESKRERCPYQLVITCETLPPS